MQEETVEFKMDVSDENIKREAMRVVWMDSGVTLVDIKEKGILKVKGIFGKIVMGSKLYEIDNSVDIINPMGKPGPSRIPGLSTVYNYLTTPKIQEIVVFKFKVLDDSMKRDAMKAIWEFSGITSVEVKKDNQVEVKGGEFNKISMSTKLKEIDEYVSVTIKAGPEVGGTKINNRLYFNMSPTHVPVRAPVPAPTPITVPAPTPVPVPAPARNPDIRRISSPARRLHLPVKTSIWTKCFRCDCR
ncbi:PREDICTED: uncharacterized protein LOC104725781 [Camelina sativa]|uniref:Uncharacterized protein LOC104725781 n=1 Tax=Camelina sativa TaxID=90675 RepID=A0ABM0UL91_CAMSA|nr:PREDICTED: uncharacterized protein LOC104725781 [Camelina sativa]